MEAVITLFIVFAAYGVIVVFLSAFNHQLRKQRDAEKEYREEATE